MSICAHCRSEAKDYTSLRNPLLITCIYFNAKPITYICTRFIHLFSVLGLLLKTTEQHPGVVSFRPAHHRSNTPLACATGWKEPSCDECAFGCDENTGCTNCLSNQRFDTDDTSKNFTLTFGGNDCTDISGVVGLTIIYFISTDPIHQNPLASKSVELPLETKDHLPGTITPLVLLLLLYFRSTQVRSKHIHNTGWSSQSG